MILALLQNGSSMYTAIDSLKLPAAVLIGIGVYIWRFRALEKRIEEVNVAKEDKIVVATLAEDIKRVSAREAVADAKLEKRVANMGLVIVALASKDDQHEVIKGLKGE